MNSFVVAVCVCLTLVVEVKGGTPEEDKYSWNVDIEQGPGSVELPSYVVGSIYMHVDTEEKQNIEVCLDSNLNFFPGGQFGRMISANTTWTQTFKSVVYPFSIKAAKLEWFSQYDPNKKFSIRKVTITEPKSDKTIAFCYYGEAVFSGTKVNATIC